MSKKNVSGFVSVMGVALGFVTNLVSVFQKRGGTDEDLHQLLVGSKSEDFVGQIVNLAMEMVKKAKPAFPIFKIIILGLHQSIKAYRKALTKAGFRIGDWASDILNKIQVSQKQIQLDLVIMSVADLGFKEATRLDKIYAKAKELGLELCPAEVGPAFRLAYPNQPYGEYLRIAMEPISDSIGDLGFFRVDHDDYFRWLFSYYDYPDNLWRLGPRFVFVLSCK